MSEGESDTAPSSAQKPVRSEFLDSLEDFSTHPEYVNKKRIEAKTPLKPAPQFEAVLDLHACTLELALRRTEEFLLRCHVKHLRRVLVIHGKGSGVLREGVRSFLQGHPLVAQTESAPRHKGGDGATVALLRR